MTQVDKTHVFSMDSKSMKNVGGLGWLTTSLFLIADMAGGGIVALPVAMVQSGGCAGIIIITTLAIGFCYTAHILGENWLIMCERWDTYNEHCRKPYSEMAYRAMGKSARWICSAIINVMLFCVSVVYLLLSSHIINDFITSVTGYNIGFCIMILIIACILNPITFLKSPKDFWLALIIAMLTTAVAACLIVIGTLLDAPYCYPERVLPEFSSSRLMLSLGTYMFGFGGHAVFPTIQHDMQNPHHFTGSSILAFAVVTFMYGSISATGYLIYGDSIESSIISSIQTVWIQRGADFFIAVHCILTLTIVINPLNQEVEQFFNSSHDFGWSRVAIRTAVMLCVIFVAESIPNFGPILNLIGGTSVALTSAILPSLYNIFLKAAVFDGSSKIYHRPTLMEVYKRTPLLQLSLKIIIIVVAVVCGTATTYSAVSDIFTTQFIEPCYFKLFKSRTALVSHEMPTHCCGGFRNISRYDDSATYCAFHTFQ